MNLDLINSKLTALSSPKGNSSQNKEEKEKSFWKPTVGKALVRFVPSATDPENPFKELYFHYTIGKRTIISPVNFNEKDPIVEFSKELRKTKEPENWKMAKKLEPKMRVFTPIIVRGEEEKGVRFWEFGKEIYQALLSLAADEEIGDFTDILQGRDLKVDTVGKDVTGTDYNKTTVMPAMKTSPLSKSNDEVEKWLSTQPDLFSFYRRYTFDEIKQFLTDFLNPQTEEVKTEEAGDQFLALPKTQNTPIKNEAFSLKKKEETLPTDEFDDLFSK